LITQHPALSTQHCVSSAEVRAEARRLGFEAVGIAPAERFVEAEPRLVDWVRGGRHGRMGWIDEARVRRSCRPDELLPGSHSLIAVGAVYSSRGSNRAAPVAAAEAAYNGNETPPAALGGRVARYARGRDYHDLLKGRLWELVGFLRRQAGSEVCARVFVDDGPLADREAAVRAGLGFYGKNTCLLSGSAGSYLLLGAILTDLPLDPDSPQMRDCGSCRICLDACPTGALETAYQLDARRCISYLTIELRGAIPPELRTRLGDNVFGCDICQEVCPWNHGRGPVPWPEFAAHNPSGLDLPGLLDLDEDGFRRQFKGSPLKRARRGGLLRNAAVALGNSGDQRAVPALARSLTHDPDPLVRSHAAWGLRRLGGAEAEAALATALQREQDDCVRREIEGRT
jgi:epoxyqueuosine reductase